MKFVMIIHSSQEVGHNVCGNSLTFPPSALNKYGKHCLTQDMFKCKELRTFTHRGRSLQHIPQNKFNKISSKYMRITKC